MSYWPSSTLAEVEAVYPDAVVMMDTQLAHMLDLPGFRLLLTPADPTTVYPLSDGGMLLQAGRPAQLAAYCTKRQVETNGYIHFRPISAHWHPTAGVWSRGSYGVSSYPRRPDVAYARKDVVTVEEARAQRTSGPQTIGIQTPEEWITARREWTQPLRDRLHAANKGEWFMDPDVGTPYFKDSK